MALRQGQTPDQYQVTSCQMSQILLPLIGSM